ncbi:fungal-specific transcription factor domain-containing protein [Kockiozyma suomiensis]|uniref:fungal-specific transcription factor domain-containing protein n=1 Tax=Kockiozyma suomiensis TaxID=1337062 RepID=UPI003343674B
MASSGSSRTIPTSRRTRTVISCTECHRRKQKCDRQQPCNQCVVRKVEGLCHYSCRQPSASASSRAYSAATTAAATAVSSAPQQPQFQFSVPRNNAASITSSSEDSSDEDDAIYDHADDYDMNSDAASSSDFENDIDDDDEEYSDIVDVLGYFRSGVSNIARDIAELKLSPKFISSADFFDAGGEFKGRKGVSSRNAKVVQRILRQMPPKPYVELLIRIFFREANYYQSINEIEFWDSLNKWWISPNRVENVIVATLTFRIMSIALQFVPEEHLETVRQIDESLDSLSADYSQCASELAALLPDCVDKVHECILRAAWLKFEARMKESWYCIATAVRMAQEIKLHVEEKDCPPSYERERRRRLWWTIYYWDRCLGLILGRPIMIEDDICSVPLPLDLPDDCLYPTLKDGPAITEFTGRVLSFKLSEYISDLDRNPQRLFRNLTIFTASLPGYFSIYSPDTSLDDQYPFLVAHRESLATTICMVLCALYRRKIAIPNPLSFCLRLLTAAERTLNLSQGDQQYRHFMIVYANLEPSVLMCREILKMSGRLAEARFIVSADRNGNAIDVFTCLNFVDDALKRMRLIRTRNKIAIKAYRILKELVRRVKIQVEREKGRYNESRSASVNQTPMCQNVDDLLTPQQQKANSLQQHLQLQRQLSNELDSPASPGASTSSVMLSDRPDYASLASSASTNDHELISMLDYGNINEHLVGDAAVLEMLHRLNAQTAAVNDLLPYAPKGGRIPLTPPDGRISSVPIVMPMQPTILEDDNSSRPARLPPHVPGTGGDLNYLPPPDRLNLAQNPHANTTHATVILPPPDVDFADMEMDSEMMFSWADAYSYNSMIDQSAGDGVSNPGTASERVDGVGGDRGASNGVSTSRDFGVFVS